MKPPCGIGKPGPPIPPPPRTTSAPEEDPFDRLSCHFRLVAGARISLTSVDF